MTTVSVYEQRKSLETIIELALGKESELPLRRLTYTACALVTMNCTRLTVFIPLPLTIVFFFQGSLRPQEEAKGFVARTAFFSHHKFFNTNVSMRQGLTAT